MPAESQPTDIVLDGIDEFLAFLERIGVIEAEIAMTPVFFRQSEIQADRLGVADMEVAIGFRRKTGMHPAAMFAGGQVPGNHLANEAGRFGASGGAGGFIV